MMLQDNEKTDEHLRARIRMIIWKQWKRPKTQIKNLVKCGYSIDAARGLAYCRNHLSTPCISLKNVIKYTSVY